MTNPKYRPRDFSAEPDAFGKSQNMKWKPVQDDDQRATLHAARLQHYYAFRIRARMKAERITLKFYASKVGQSYDRTTKMLRGEVIMRLEDIAAADIVLGQVSEFDIARANRAKQGNPAEQATTR